MRNLRSYSQLFLGIFLWFNLIDRTYENNIILLIVNIVVIVLSLFIIAIPIYNLYQRKKNKEVVDDKSYLYDLSLIVFLSGVFYSLLNI